MSFSSTSKFVVENKSAFRENVTIDSGKIVQVGNDASGLSVIKMAASSTKQYIQVGKDNEFKVDENQLYFGDSKTDQFAQLTKTELSVGDIEGAVLSKSSLGFKDASGLGMELTETQLKFGNDASGQGVLLKENQLQLASGVELAHTAESETAAASLKLQLDANNYLQLKHCGAATVGDHKNAHHPYFESMDASGSQKLKGFLPVLNSNHQIPMSYLQSTLSFDGKLKFRHFVAMIWDASLKKWVLDTDIVDPSNNITHSRPMATKASWYAGAQTTLHPAYDITVNGGDPSQDADGNSTGKFHNFAFATGSYFLVTFSSDGHIDASGSFSSSGTPAPAPFNSSIANVLTQLGAEGYLQTYENGTDDWYGDGKFAPIAQLGTYETSHSDMIVIRNSGDASVPVEVTVVDNTDEFQKRLIDEKQVHFPVAGTILAPPTLKVTDQILHIQTASSNADAIKLNAPTGGVQVDASGTISLASKGDVTPSAVQVSADKGGVDIDAKLNIDMEAGGAIELTSTSTDASGAIRLESSASTDAKAVMISSVQGGVDVTSKEQLYLESTDADIGLQAKSNIALDSSEGDVTIDASGQVSLQSKKGVTEIKSGHAGDADLVTIGNSAMQLVSDGGLAVSTVKKQKFQSTDASDNAIYLNAKNGGIDIDSKKAIDMYAQGAVILKSSESSKEAIHLQTFATGGGITLESKVSTALDSVQVLSLEGGVKVHSDASGSVSAAILVETGIDNKSAQSIKLRSMGGGINLQSAGNTTVKASSAFVDSPIVELSDGKSNSVVLVKGDAALSIGNSCSQRVYEVSKTSNFRNFELHLQAPGPAISYDDLTVLDVSVVGSDGDLAASRKKAFFKGTFVISQSCVVLESTTQGQPDQVTYKIDCTAGNYFKSDNLTAKVYYPPSNLSGQAPHAPLLLVLSFHWKEGYEYSTTTGGRFTAHVQAINTMDNSRNRYKFTASGLSSVTAPAAIDSAATLLME